METTMHLAQDIKQAAVDHPIHPLLEQRWSPRAFDAQAVEPDKVRSILEAARWSASGGNKQPWHFIVAARGEEGFATLASVLNPANAVWAAQAPLLLLVVSKITTDEGQFNPYGYYDAGLALQNLTVQATALGLFVHQMAGFSAERAGKATVSLPSCTSPVNMAGPSSNPSGCMRRVTAPSGAPATSKVRLTGAVKRVGKPSRRK